MDLKKTYGIGAYEPGTEDEQRELERYVNVKLKAMGLTSVLDESELPFIGMADALLSDYQEKQRLLSSYLSPVDQRIQDFMLDYFRGCSVVPQLPDSTFILDRHGIARILSLPAKSDKFSSGVMESYRVANGVLNNPASDRRTTKGVFHIAEDGLPIPDDKKAVPREAAANLIAAAFEQPEEVMSLPYTADLPQDEQAHSWVSLLLRPVVIPEVEGFTPEKRMEVRFFVPGNLVSNLDFVETIFGNGGDPFLPENDSALDPERWTGTTGCVILATHLVGIKKKAIGLPHVSEATERQKRDGMCWEDEDEAYNDGGAFKLTVRDERGVVVTIVSDSYFGYCKKEVKTQISMSANLFGMAEEEHAGGALVFAGYDLGEEFFVKDSYADNGATFAEIHELFSDVMEVEAGEGYAVDKKYPDIFYIPENSRISLETQKIEWEKDGQPRSIQLLPDHTYVCPSGYKIEMVQPSEGRRWRLQGHVADGLYCHKPCTVSGGGKSEISKPITDAIITGPVFVQDIKQDFDAVESILQADFRGRFRDPAMRDRESRPILSTSRSLGSVIKLLTPSQIEYTEEYNTWLESIPQHVKELVYLVKRFYKSDWENDWRSRFSVDIINGKPGNELRYRGRKLITQYLRVGYTEGTSWRIFNLRKDFMPAAKVAMEDDITASTVAPTEALHGLDANGGEVAYKFAFNCEHHFFQRPDDAIVRGYDKQAEKDIAGPGTFLSNYEPLNRTEAAREKADTIRFTQYTQPIQDLIENFLKRESPEYYVSSASPRMVDGKPTKNPRYLQVRPDVVYARSTYLGEIGARLSRKVQNDRSLLVPVGACLPGRRNNPPEPEAGVRPLCVYNPIHYMPLPELFMEFIASITGKSPSTTGAGSEGALTKAPFNCLLPVHDLNNALVSMALTGFDGFITSAGYVGPQYRVDHDVSLLVPELWGRLRPEERTPEYMIEHGYLEKVEDIEKDGRKYLASRLGYRITSRFVRIVCGRVFTDPVSVFTQEMLQPERQGEDIYLDGIDNITTAHQWVAEYYFRDGSINLAVPPLKALLTIMAKGEYEGKGVNHPEIRALFDPESIRQSDWYQRRLGAFQDAEAYRWERHLRYLRSFQSRESHQRVARKLGIEDRIARAEKRLESVQGDSFRDSIVGSLGREPTFKI